MSEPALQPPEPEGEPEPEEGEQPAPEPEQEPQPQALGEPTAANYPPDPYSKPCPTCDGWGMLRTPSHVNGQQALPCPDCGSKGWIPEGTKRGPLTVVQTGVTTSAEGAPALEQPPAQDPWGRGPEHPDYGRLPNYVR